MADQSLPLWGRWHGEAVAEAGSTNSPNQMQFGGMVPQPHQSKIKDFCQLPQRGSLRALPRLRDKSQFAEPLPDDIGPEYTMECPASSRRAATVHRTVAFDWFESRAIKQEKTTPNGVVFSCLVDDIGLEPMTFRTSSGCSSQLS